MGTRGYGTLESAMMFRSSTLHCTVHFHSAPGLVKRAIWRIGRMWKPRRLALSTSRSHGRSSSGPFGASVTKPTVAVVRLQRAGRTLAIATVALPLPPSNSRSSGLEVLRLQNTGEEFCRRDLRAAPPRRERGPTLTSRPLVLRTTWNVQATSEIYHGDMH